MREAGEPATALGRRTRTRLVVAATTERTSRWRPKGRALRACGSHAPRRLGAWFGSPATRRARRLLTGGAAGDHVCGPLELALFVVGSDAIGRRPEADNEHCYDVGGHLEPPGEPAPPRAPRCLLVSFTASFALLAEFHLREAEWETKFASRACDRFDRFVRSTRRCFFIKHPLAGAGLAELHNGMEVATAASTHNTQVGSKRRRRAPMDAAGSGRRADRGRDRWPPGRAQGPRPKVSKTE